jgi:hypothetical protein
MSGQARAQAAFDRRLPSELPFWGLVDSIAICAPKDVPVERPEAVDVAIRPLSRMLDCPLCSRDVNSCRCEPEQYAAAVYAALSKQDKAA